MLSACAVTNQFEPGAKAVSVMRERSPGITMENLKEGMVIYKRNCSSCHQLYPPAAFTQQKWEKSLKEMFPRARITDESMQGKVRNYLYARAK